MSRKYEFPYDSAIDHTLAYYYQSIILFNGVYVTK